MHEYALAEAVIATAIEKSKEEGLKEITKIKIKIGELQQIEVDTFKFIIEEVMKSNREEIKNTKIEFETERGLLKCRVCENKFELGDLTEFGEDGCEAIHFVPEIAHIYIRCPKCKSPDFDIIEGRGVTIETIEGNI